MLSFGTLKDMSGLPKDWCNSELIKRLMDNTFPYRRHVIVKEVICPKDLFDKFPLIRTREQVHIQFYIFIRFIGILSMYQVCSVIVISDICNLPYKFFIERANVKTGAFYFKQKACFILRSCILVKVN